VYPFAGISILTSGLTANIHPTGPERNGRPGLAGSACFWMKQRAARPQNGRSLQNQPLTPQDGFVAPVPSRVFRDATGIVVVKLRHSLRHSMHRPLTYYIGDLMITRGIELPYD
jgi:hypothetical protein